MHGYGQLFYSNGDSCVGSWSYGQLKKGKDEDRDHTYIWADGSKALVTADLQGDIRFPETLTIYYPDNDFREEYHGEVNDKGIPHGQGKIILKDGNHVVGEWKDGLNASIDSKLKQQEWQKKKEEADKITHEEQLLSILDEKLYFSTQSLEKQGLPEDL